MGWHVGGDCSRGGLACVSELCMCVRGGGGTHRAPLMWLWLYNGMPSSATCFTDSCPITSPGVEVIYTWRERDGA
jgi:hypothetical protein